MSLHTSHGQKQKIAQRKRVLLKCEMNKDTPRLTIGDSSKLQSQRTDTASVLGSDNYELLKLRRKKILDEKEEDRRLRKRRPIREVDLGNGMSTAGREIKFQLKQANYYKRP